MAVAIRAERGGHKRIDAEVERVRIAAIFAVEIERNSVDALVARIGDSVTWIVEANSPADRGVIWKEIMRHFF